MARLADAFNTSLGRPAGLYTAARLQPLVFGADAFLAIAVAETEGGVVGYATYHDGFDPFLAAPALFLADLYVAPGSRSRGLGRRLMAFLAGEAVSRGRASIWWGIDVDNARGEAFYLRLGARDVNDRIMLLDGAALAALAEEIG